MNPAYTSDYHGLVHPLSLFQVESLIQTTRMPTVKLHSLGFKVRRKRFQIETFTLPPEDEDETAEQQAGNCSTGKSKLDF
jgi:elongator complex protein 4